MKRAWIALVATPLLLSATMATQEDEGWVDLFDGQTLDGWEQKGGAAEYSVEDGAIVGTSVPNTDNSFLYTRQQYGDFVLEFEFLGHPALNSGVQIRSESQPDFKNGRVHGYQCELEDEGKDRNWFCGIYDEGRRGWLLPKDKDSEEARQFGEAGKRLWKNGEWNLVRIEARGDHIQTWLNGELRADLHDDMTLRGFIALQVHGVGGRQQPMSVKWRNIRLKTLREPNP
ncbi:MAG: DUF1080 domain-containing protein [Candidatus Hydrogenedentes bacterium]|nr:DUF1080 domain-containing protein [Candidatus Hydrogenedentota bacterium]